MLMENFRISRPVGTGHSRPNDVIRLRKALRETGHGSSPPNPSGVYDSSLNGTIKRFQSDYGLEPDGVVTPDGPTTRMLDLALATQRQGGKEGQAQLRQMVSAITGSGLKPKVPPPGDKRPIVFADANNRIATPDQVVGIISRSLKPSTDRRNRTASASTAVAAGTAEAAMADGMAAGGNLVSGSSLAETIATIVPAAIPLAAFLAGGAIVSGFGYAADKWGKAHPDYLAQKQSERDAATGPIADRMARQRARHDASGAQRTIDPEANTNILPGTPLNGSPHIPTPPLTHPPVPHDGEPETFPTEGPKFPTHTATPINPPDLPQILIFPDLSGSLPDTTIIHSDRGNDDTKRQILEAQIRFQRQHHDWTHLAGGYDLTGKDLHNGTFDIKDLVEVPERAIKGPGSAFPDKRGRPGDGRPGSRFPDILYRRPDGKLVAVNTVSVDSKGQIEQYELDAAESLRRQGIEVYLIKKTHQMKR